MGWFTSNRSYELVRLNEAVIASFHKVKGDIGTVHEWIKFLHEQNRYQQQLLQQFSTELASRKPPTAQELIPIVQPLVEQQTAILQSRLQQDLKTSVRRELFNAQPLIKRAIERELQTHIQHAVQSSLRHTQSTIFDRLRLIEGHINHLAQQPRHDPGVAERLQEMESKVTSVESQLVSKLSSAESQLSSKLSTMESQFTAKLQPTEERLRHVEAKMQPAEDRLQKIESKLAEHPQAFDKLTQMLEKLEQRSTQPTAPVIQTVYKEPDAVSNLQRKILQKVQRNSKAYVKTVLTNTINKYGQLNGLQLKEMIVDEQGIVSKSSLYRLLNELEEEGRISVSQDGKEKIYRSFADDKQAKHPNQNI